MKTLVRDAASQKVKISIHPKVAAIFDAAFGMGLIWFFGQVVSAWWMLGIWIVVRIIWWVGLMRIVYYARAVRRIDHVRSLIVFQIGICCSMLFVDWSLSWYTWGTLFVLGSAVSFWLLPTLNSDLSFISKPHVRWCLMMTVIGIAGVWSGTAAVTVFYPFLNWIIAWIVATIWTILVSLAWWRYYGAPQDKILLFWAVLMEIVLLQLSAIILFWSVGFLISGMVITWLWYLLWQLGRFYFAPDGINWKKQRFFLITNLIGLSAVIIFLARWK